MSSKTLEYDTLIERAIEYYNGHNKLVSQLKTALLIRVNSTTLSWKLRGLTKSISTNGGQNRLLSKAQIDAIL